MGLEDRDWYWRRRARKNVPDDDYLFPTPQRSDRKSAIFPIVLVVLAVLALLVFGLGQGWFDRDWRWDGVRKRAEISALRPWEQQRSQNGQRRSVPEAHGSPRVQTFHDEHRLSIEFTLLGLMILSPLVLLGLLICLFVSRLRGPALIGLLLGIAGAVIGGNMGFRALLFRLGLLYPADSMGGAFQFLEIVASAFTLAAVTGAVVVFVFGKPGTPPSVAATSPTEVDPKTIGR